MKIWEGSISIFVNLRSGIITQFRRVMYHHSALYLASSLLYPPLVSWRV